MLIAEERGHYEVLVFEGEGAEPVELVSHDLGPYTTPGEGLDAAIAWGHQRGVKIVIPLLTIRKLNNG